MSSSGAPVAAPSSEAESLVRVDRPAPHVARVLIDRPAKRNAIDAAVRGQLFEAFGALAGDASVRAIVVGGANGTFSAGGDVPSMGGLDDAGARQRMAGVHALCRRVAALPLPVVAAVEGVAAGGAVGLALLADRVVVGPSTKILFPFLGLGLAPDWAQVYTLPLRVGTATARRLFLAGAAVGGDEALAIGLADERVADDRVMATALERAAAFASLPQEAFARTKARLARPSASLEEELAREADDAAACMTGDEFAEGHAAFMEKRRPDFVAARRKG